MMKVSQNVIGQLRNMKKAPRVGVGDIAVIAGSLHAGSFYAEGATASDTFLWVAVGAA